MKIKMWKYIFEFEYKKDKTAHYFGIYIKNDITSVFSSQSHLWRWRG
jgi:hypothetical protein